MGRAKRRQLRPELARHPGEGGGQDRPSRPGRERRPERAVDLAQAGEVGEGADLGGLVEQQHIGRPSTVSRAAHADSRACTARAPSPRPACASCSASRARAAARPGRPSGSAASAARTKRSGEVAAVRRSRETGRQPSAANASAVAWSSVVLPDPGGPVMRRGGPLAACRVAARRSARAKEASLRAHQGRLHSALARHLQRARVAGIGVPDDAGAGIGGEDALQARRRAAACRPRPPTSRREASTPCPRRRRGARRPRSRRPRR